jgi:hypothetical protein
VPVAAAGEPELSFLQVTAPDKAAYLRLFTLGLDLPEHQPGARVTVIGTSADKAWLEAQGYQVDYLLPDASRFFAARAEAAGALTMGGFRTLSEIWTAVDSLVSGYPSVVSSKRLIGTTHQGRPIYAIRISDNPEVDEGEPAVLFTGLHHAREPIGPHIVIYTMQQLPSLYGVDSDITALVNGRELWFIPVINPDGYAYNESTNPTGGGLWRKNRRNNGDGTFGVDLNRNYGYQWGFDDVGSSPSTGSDTYRGPGSFSEPETQAIQNFCLAYPNIRIALNYHSFSNLLLYPWGFEVSYTPDHTLFAAIADSAVTLNGYTPTPGWGLYLTNGDSDDWMYGIPGILSYTPEVGSSPNVPPYDGFWPSPSRIAPLTLENYPVNIFMASIADEPRRLLPPDAPLWDSIVVVGSDSISLWWHPADTLVNTPVSYDVKELFGPAQVPDGFEAGTASWSLDKFARSSAKAYSGIYSLFSDPGDYASAFATAREPLAIDSSDTLRFWINYAIETGWDYAYVEVSTDGGITYYPIPGNITTVDNPHGNNLGHGITDSSLGWVLAEFSLSDFAGQQANVRFAYRTDAAVRGSGVYLDNVFPVQVYDSVRTVATVSAPPAPLGAHPPGDYYFRLFATDAQAQVSVGQSLAFSYSSQPPYIVGDVNESGSITAADVIYLVNFVFKGGPAPLPVWQAGDVNATSSITSADIVYLVNYVFKGGPPPIGP